MSFGTAHELVEWMDRRDYGSVTQLRGATSHGNVTDPAGFERANYLRMLASYHPHRMIT